MKPRPHFHSVSILASLALALPVFAANEPAEAAPNAPEPPAKPEPAVRVEAEAQMIPADGGGDEAAKPDVAMEEKTYLGINSIEVPDFLGKHLHLPPGTGVLVRSLDKNGPAAKEGIAKDDVITKVDGKAVASQQEMIDLIQAKKPGDKLEIESIHEGQPAKASVTLGSHKVDKRQRIPGMMMPGLENLPPEEQKRIRGEMEQMLKGQGGLEIFPGGMIPDGGMIPGEGGPQAMELRVGGMSAQMKMMDQDGSIEMKDRDGGKEVKVADKEGKEVWSGPWDTEQDKAAAPPEIRARIERLGGGALLKHGTLRLGGGARLAPAPPQEEEADPAPAPEECPE